MVILESITVYPIFGHTHFAFLVLQVVLFRAHPKSSPASHASAMLEWRVDTLASPDHGLWAPASSNLVN